MSEVFDGKKLLERHRAVNDLLAAELEGPVHALSMQCKTPEQWAKSGGAVNPSPKCLGGMAREAKEKEQQGAVE